MTSYQCVYVCSQRGISIILTYMWCCAKSVADPLRQSRVELRGCYERHVMKWMQELSLFPKKSIIVQTLTNWYRHELNLTLDTSYSLMNVLLPVYSMFIITHTIQPSCWTNVPFQRLLQNLFMTRVCESFVCVVCC